MEQEEKEFVVKDRRSFDDKGELKKDDEALEEKKESPAGDEEKKEAEKGDSERVPLPEANFTSLVFSLSSSALFNLGEVPDPQTGEKKKDLQIAKHAIDTIAMLKEKTQGNLSREESQFLEQILTDVRWRFVKASE